MSSIKYTMMNRQSQLLANLNEYRKVGEFCDITLIIDNQEVYAHRAILAASSQYFRSMFGNNFQESRCNVIAMKEVEYSAMMSVFDFIYTSEIQLNVDNILNVMEAADILQIHPLRQYVNHFVKKNLTAKNCLMFYATSKFRDYDDAAEVAFRYLVEHFEEVLTESCYDDLPVNLWQNILSSDVINVPDENFLLEALIKWYQHSPENRLTDLNHLSSFINITNINLEKLNQHLTYLEGTELYTRIINVVDCFRVQSSRKDGDVSSVDDEKYMKRMFELNLPVNFKKDRFPVYNEIMLVTGGSNSASPECYSGMSSPWSFRLPEWGWFKPKDESQLVIPGTPSLGESASACNRSEMYVLGGFSDMVESILSSCYRYNVIDNSWKSITPLPKATSNAAAAYCNGKLYISGGVNDITTNVSVNTLLNYMGENSDNGRWIELSPMLQSRTSHQLCSVNGELYAIGGATVRLEPNINGDTGATIFSKTLRSVEKYSPFLNEWKLVSKMHHRRMGFCAAVVDEYIYVFGGSHYTKGSSKTMLGNTERYNTLTETWEPLEPMPFLAREGLCATVFKNRIYIMGGADHGMRYNSVHSYNPDTGRWQYATPMHFDRVNGSVGTLSLPENRKKQESVGVKKSHFMRQYSLRSKK